MYVDYLLLVDCLFLSRFRFFPAHFDSYAFKDVYVLASVPLFCRQNKPSSCPESRQEIRKRLYPAHFTCMGSKCSKPDTVLQMTPHLH